MSDIARFTIWGCVYTPASSGEWVRYDDHRAELEQLTAQLHQTRAEVERLKNAIDHLTSERDEAQAEVERLTAERDEARGEVERLTRMTVADFALAEYRKRWPR